MVSTAVYVPYDMELSYLYACFAKAYCEILPFDAYQKLSATLSHIKEWYTAAQYEERTIESNPCIHGIIPSITEMLVAGFEGSKEYSEIRKLTGVTYSTLMKMDECIRKQLQEKYEKPAISVRGGIGDKEVGKIPNPTQY